MSRSITQAYIDLPITIGSTLVGRTGVLSIIIALVIIIHALYGVFLV